MKGKSLLVNVAVVGLLISIPIMARAAHYEKCQFLGGKLIQCDGVYTGKATVLSQNHFRQCMIDHGQIANCDLHVSNGSIIISMPSHLDYERCHLNRGQISSCVGPFSGKAVVERPS